MASREVWPRRNVFDRTADGLLALALDSLSGIHKQAQIQIWREEIWGRALELFGKKRRFGRQRRRG